MATLIDLPTTPTVALSTLSVGAWCTLSAYPGDVFCVLEIRATDCLLARFGSAADCAPLARTKTTMVTEVPAPSITLDFTP